MARKIGVGSRVSYRPTYRKFVGTVRRLHTITVLGEPEVVADVAWDGNPSSRPYAWKDEGGTGRKRGHLLQDLVVVNEEVRNA